MWRLLAVCTLGLLLGAVAMDGYVAYEQPKYERSRPQRARRLLPVTLPERAFRRQDLGQFGSLPDVYPRRFSVPRPEEVALGRMFFFDKRFSRNHDVSCNSCHPLDNYGMDNRGVSKGHLGQTGRRNAPTVYNAAGNGIQFWDGRARDVEEQATMPMQDPFEMAMTEPRILETVRSIPEYVERLKAIFPNEPDPVNLQSIGFVIGAFERQLVTPSRWDDFLEGDEQALTEREKRGFVTFFQLGCPSCHSGRLIGGGHFERLGQARPWPNQTDMGYSQRRENKEPMFKVASLRNVAKTAPYFHDASADTLEAAVKKMAAYQLGIQLSDAQAGSITAFLGTLTGDLPYAYTWQPELPPSTAATPKPTRDGY